jgi:hypothetical protein
MRSKKERQCSATFTVFWTNTNPMTGGVSRPLKAVRVLHGKCFVGKERLKVTY